MASSPVFTFPSPYRSGLTAGSRTTRFCLCEPLPARNVLILASAMAHRLRVAQHQLSNDSLNGVK